MSPTEQWRIHENGGESHMAVVVEQHIGEGQFAHTEALNGVEDPHQRTRRPPYECTITSCQERTEPLAGPSEGQEVPWMQVAEDLGHRGAACGH